MPHSFTDVGKYRIVSQIGEGAMGVVYRALDPVLNRPVAIKVMSDAVARDDDLRGRFLREAQAAGSLRHPNVITIYDFGEIDGHLYIAMEFVEGEDLEDLLEKRVPLTVLQKIDVLIDVLTGLAYAHKRGIVHRDIKPANIRIDEEGRARIMDFGIAHVTSSKMTKTGIMVGTPAYMAPEQIVGGPVTPESDIFSVGAVMYELLTNTKPFDGSTLQSIMYKIVSQPAPDIAKVVPGLPASLNAIVQRALAKEPSARYGSAVEMAAALAEARGAFTELSESGQHLSLRSTIETSLAEIRTARARRAKRRTILAGILAAAGTAGVFAVIMWVQARRAATPVTQRASPSAVSARDSIAVTPAADDRPKRPAPSVTATGASATPTSEELRLFRSLHASALQTRRDATDAGATDKQLQVGDEHNRAADALVAQGKITAAAGRLEQAVAAWTTAGRAGRTATTAVSPPAPAAASEVTKQPPVAPPVATSPVVPSVVVPSAVAAAPLPAPAPPNHAAEIANAVAAYGRAIESRDLAAVRRAYPGITPVQAKGFDQFFASVRSLRATFTVTGLEVDGASAEARLVGAYDFVTNAGKSERQPVSFQASFRREGTSWAIASVR